MAGTYAPPKLSLAAYVDWMQDAYQLSDMQVAEMLTKLATHYIMKDSKYGQLIPASNGKVAGTEGT